MEKVYIKGVPGRGKSVIAELERLGGYNHYNISGDEDDKIYFLKPTGLIACASIESSHGTCIMWAGTEIFLPEDQECNIKDIPTETNEKIDQDMESTYQYPDDVKIYDSDLYSLIRNEESIKLSNTDAINLITGFLYSYDPYNYNYIEWEDLYKKLSVLPIASKNAAEINPNDYKVTITRNSKFKVGDKVILPNFSGPKQIYTVKFVDFKGDDIVYKLLEKGNANYLEYELSTQPKFNVGDLVRDIRSDEAYIIKDIHITTLTTTEFDYPTINSFQYVVKPGISEPENYLERVDFKKLDIPILRKLAEYDPVMVSEDGVEWFLKRYKSDSLCSDFVTTWHVDSWRYIVKVDQFDFNDFESNVKRNIINKYDSVKKPRNASI